MLDIKLFRDEKEYKKILESEKKRNHNLEYAEKTKEYDSLWRKVKQTCEEKKAEKNKITKEIAERGKAKENIEPLKEKAKALDNDIKVLEQKQTEYLELRDKYRNKVGNVLWHDVPYGKGEEENKLIKTWGKAKVQKKHLNNFKELSGNKMKFDEMTFEPKSHVDLGIEKDLFDLERAAKVSGARFYYLKNKLAILHISLLRFALDRLIKKGFTFMYTPVIINKETMEKTAELEDFEETLYKVGDDQFLIATAEQSLASFHMNEVLSKEALPIKYTGLSNCFRREAGSHSKDTRGIFRVHQFDKVEQYVFCLPEDSEKMHAELIKNEEEIIQELEIPYRLVNICSGDLNNTAAKKIDLEAWMPVQGTFRELGSGSITTDYQTRNLNVKYEDKKEKKVVHSLNCTTLASPRILTAIIENFQDETGTIHIPKALHSYTGFDKI